VLFDGERTGRTVPAMTIDNCRHTHCTPSTAFGPLEVEVVRDDLDEIVILVGGELDRPAVPLLAGCLREVLDGVGSAGRSC